MEKKGKVSFSIPTHRRRRRLIKPPACLAAAADDEGTRSRSTPAPQFIAEFGPSETATPTTTPPAIVIAPLPNNFHMFRREPYDGSSLTPTIIKEAGIVFTRELDNHPRSSSHHAYGLNLPTRAAPAASTDKKESNKAPPHRQVTTSSSELLRRRFKQDIAALSDHRDTEEYPKFSAAAILAGYGWSEGQGIGRNNKKKGDTKVFTCGRRPGTGAQRQTFDGLGYNPVEISDAGKKRKRQDTTEHERNFSMRPRS